MDCEEPDWACIQAEALHISQPRWLHLMRMLVEAGYIKGIQVVHTKTGMFITLTSPELTLTGLQYLQENSLMQKAYRLAKGIKDVTPGL